MAHQARPSECTQNIVVALHIVLLPYVMAETALHYLSIDQVVESYSKLLGCARRCGGGSSMALNLR